MSNFLPGKFARFQRAGAAVTGAYRWAPGFKRERLDATNFESAVGATGINVHTEGDTGPLDTTFSVEMYLTAINLNFFFPDASLVCDLLFRKLNPLGYKNVSADVLDFSPQISVRELGKATAQLQANGLVSPAA